MSQQFNDPHNDHSSSRRRSPQQSPGSQSRFSQPIAPPPEPVNIKQEIACGLAYPSPAPINGAVNYFPPGMPNTTGIPNTGHYGTAHGYQQGHNPGYPHTQATMPNPYLHEHNAGDVYSQPGVSPQWQQSHHHHTSTDFHRSASWSPPHNAITAPPLYPNGSVSMSRMRSQVALPQRPYIPHHRQNYFDQFIPEDSITFPYRSGGQGARGGRGIALIDVMNENFDNLVGRDDSMFANYTGPAISLRLEWPGYKSWTKQIKTKDWRREPKPITRAKLAIEVAKKIQNFIQDNINEPIIPGSERWKVGPGLIQVNDLVLVNLVHVSKGSWQAMIDVVE